MMHHASCVMSWQYAWSALPLNSAQLSPITNTVSAAPCAVKRRRSALMIFIDAAGHVDNQLRPDILSWVWHITSGFWHVWVQIWCWTLCIQRVHEMELSEDEDDGLLETFDGASPVAYTNTSTHIILTLHRGWRSAILPLGLQREQDPTPQQSLDTSSAWKPLYESLAGT